jgi:hypothetical protein
LRCSAAVKKVDFGLSEGVHRQVPVFVELGCRGE